jgi:hypothetical protein
VSVADILVSKCNGRASCRVTENDEEFRKRNPCRKGLLVFLQIEYICLTGNVLLERPIICTCALQPVKTDPCLSSKHAKSNTCRIKNCYMKSPTSLFKSQ